MLKATVSARGTHPAHNKEAEEYRLMLRVTLMGNLGADPEIRFSQKGTQVASFNVAVNQVRRGPDGERQENTEWFRIKVSGFQTDYVQRLTKGTRVLVMGRLDISHFQGRDGEPRTGFDVWADEVQGMSPRLPGGDTDGMQDAESNAPEPVGAGVSSLGDANANANAARAGTNGARGRANVRTNARGSDGRAGNAQDLEDLPF